MCQDASTSFCVSSEALTNTSESQLIMDQIMTELILICSTTGRLSRVTQFS